MIPPYTERLDANPTLELRSWSALLYPEWSARPPGRDGDRQRVPPDRRGGRRRDAARGRRTPEHGRALAGRAGRLRADGARRLRSGRARAQPPTSWWPTSSPTGRRSATRGTSRRSGRRWRLAGSELRPHARVVGFDRAGDRVVAVRTATGTIPCATVVVAAGAWSAEVPAGAGPRRADPAAQGADRPLEPGPADDPADHRARPDVPRPARRLPHPDRRDRGVDGGLRRPDDRAIHRRPAAPRRTTSAPPWPTAEVERTWAGLSPGQHRLAALSGVRPRAGGTSLVATGHKRAGIQLAPASAEVIADLDPRPLRRGSTLDTVPGRSRTEPSPSRRPSDPDRFRLRPGVGHWLDPAITSSRW